MKIGISTSTFFNTVAAENMFDLMRKMRIDTTEFCLNTFSDYEKDYVEIGRASCRERVCLYV